MAKYRIVTSVLAKKHLEQIYKSGRASDIKKIELLFLELSEEPRKGTGKPERFKNLLQELVVSCRFLVVGFFRLFAINRQL